MPELNGTIDVVLGFVTIVLVLSLIIQSLQNVIKRLLRMKSRQTEQSLRLLFDYALTNDPTKYTEIKYASPIVSAACKLVGKDEPQDIGNRLLEAVKVQVREMGRKSFWGNAVLDSISKDDLTKILKSVEGQKLDDKVKKAIDGKVEQVEAWYDTVMPGIAERYERGMKWMAVALSAIVVVLFNADAINIYRYVAADSAVQEQLIQYAKDREDERKKADKDAPPTQPGAATLPQASAQKDVEPDDSTEQEQLKKDIEQARILYADYRRLGLAPFNWSDSFADYSTGWRTILGWSVMTLLLSLGAPFWEDALESLFGLKNTLRNKGKEQKTP
ncbi:MAG: hypothetical protein WAU45_04755 [Blastocatellia bacterium]